MSNVNTSWKRSQVVAATGTVGVGIDFLEKHFDVTFFLLLVVQALQKYNSSY